MLKAIYIQSKIKLQLAQGYLLIFTFNTAKTLQNMPEIFIRKAVKTDLDTLLTFEQGIIEAERPFDSTLKFEKISYYDIEKMIQSQDVVVVVAIIDHNIVGSGYARIEKAKPYLKHSKYGYLGFMYTLPECRGKGVNAAIIKHLINWCKNENVNEIRLDVYNENTIAINAYAKAGFKKHLVNMRYDAD